MISAAQQALEDAIEYARDRELFGKKLIEFQLTRYKVARMQTQLEAARQLTYYAAQLHDIEEYDIARFYRDIRLWKIGGGTTEVMWELIAKTMGL